MILVAEHSFQPEECANMTELASQLRSAGFIVKFDRHDWILRWYLKAAN